MKTAYTATFADGATITRKSDRTYTAAWRCVVTKDFVFGEETVFDGWSFAAGEVKKAGFAIDAERARKAAEAYARGWPVLSLRVEVVAAVAGGAV